MAATPSTADYHITQLQRLATEAARLSALQKNLRIEKKKHQAYLYAYMSRRGLTEYHGIKLKTVTPKPPAKRRPKKERDRALMEVCRNTGIPDPEKFLKDLKAASSSSNPSTIPSSSPYNGGYRA